MFNRKRLSTPPIRLGHRPFGGVSRFFFDCLRLIPLSGLLTISFHQHLLLAHVLHVDGAVDDELRRGAVVVLRLLTLVALDLKAICRNRHWC